MRQEPEIATGSRGPEDILSRRELARMNQANVQTPESSPSPAPYDLPPGTVEFHSEFGRLIVQLTSPADRIDPQTGVRMNARPLKLVFTHGRAVTSSLEIIHRIKGCPAECGKHVDPAGERCAPHQNFGIGKSFWDAKEAFTKGRNKRIEDAINLAASAAETDPEVAAALLERLTSKSVQLPKKTKEGTPEA